MKGIKVNTYSCYSEAKEGDTFIFIYSCKYIHVKPNSESRLTVFFSSYRDMAVLFYISQCHLCTGSCCGSRLVLSFHSLSIEISGEFNMYVSLCDLKFSETSYAYTAVFFFHSCPPSSPGIC